MNDDRVPIPRDAQDDYTGPMAQRRREFVAERRARGSSTSHIPRSCRHRSPATSNLGVAQVPIGLAGPLTILGEHAQGDFYVPLATTEGTLVASYSRGMRVLSESGGVTVTVVKHSMQRAPVFRFRDAREHGTSGSGWSSSSRRSRAWPSRRRASASCSTSSSTRSATCSTRFNYTTGDAAGQNMTGKATWAACEWIQAQHPLRPRYILSGSMDTDKKHSAINTLRTRGKRVIAECTIRNEVIQRLMRVDTQTLFRARQISTAGSIMAGSAYNGPHAANGITAVFIATGQDVANVAESPRHLTRSCSTTAITTGRSPCRH